MAVLTKIFVSLNDTDCVYPCSPLSCYPFCPPLTPPPPPFQLSKEPSPTNQTLSPLVIIIVGLLASSFLLVSYYAIIVKYCSIWNLSRRPQPQNNTTQDDFDETHNPLNQIWYANTVGLEESIINTIAVCKYKGDEGLVDGTECSVCLNEFCEDDDLRLLPKCNHAFHLPCIDTWLKSHVNCPLCRANIVSNPTNSDPTVSVEDGIPNPATESAENDWSADDSVGDHRPTMETDAAGGRTGETEISLLETGKSSSPTGTCQFLVLSDLARNHPLCEPDMDEIQPIRRSVSLDESSSSAICVALANLHPTRSEGISAGHEFAVDVCGSRVSKPSTDHKKINLGELPGLKDIFLKHNRKQLGNVLQKGPVALKRSFSSSSRFLSRYSRSRNSVLPL